MARKSLKSLAKEYEVEDFKEYVIESYFNGNFSQIPELLNEMKRRDLAIFLGEVADGTYCISGPDEERNLRAYIVDALS